MLKDNNFKNKDTFNNKFIYYPLYAVCHECGWKGKIEECGQISDCDGWENPIYIVHTCPVCGGDIEDYT